MTHRSSLVSFVFSAGTPSQSHATLTVKQTEPTIPVFAPKQIIDADKQIDELGANKQPYANVHIDFIG
jgi:hypothetical protein